MSSDQPTHLQAERVLCAAAVQRLWVAKSRAGEGKQGEPLGWIWHKDCWVLRLSKNLIMLTTSVMFCNKRRRCQKIFRTPVGCWGTFRSVYSLINDKHTQKKMLLRLLCCFLLYELKALILFLINDLIVWCFSPGAFLMSGSRTTSPRKSSFPTAAIQRGRWHIWWLFHRGA